MGRINTHAFGALYTVHTRESRCSLRGHQCYDYWAASVGGSLTCRERVGGRPRERREDIVTFYSKVSGELEGARLSPPRVWFQIPWCPCIYAWLQLHCSTCTPLSNSITQSTPERKSGYSRFSSPIYDAFSASCWCSSNRCTTPNSFIFMQFFYFPDLISTSAALFNSKSKLINLIF